MRWTVEKALAHWQKQGLMDASRADELRASLKQSADSADHATRLINVFAMIGSILVGLGVILFVSSNWGEMGPLLRGAVLFLGYGVFVGAATVTANRNLPKVSEALWFLATIAVGANIFFLGQIFHFSLTFWQGPFLWLIAALAMGYARQKEHFGFLAVPLGLLALGWLGGGSGWFADDQMEFLSDERGLRPLLPLIGTGLIGASYLFERRADLSFLVRAHRAWGVFLIVLPLVITSAHDEVVEMYHTAFTLKQIVIAIAAVALVGVAVHKGNLQHRILQPTLLGLAALFFVFTLQSGDGSWLDLLFERHLFFFLLYGLGMFALALFGTHIGKLIQSARLQNICALATTAVLVVQGAGWSFGRDKMFGLFCAMMIIAAALFCVWYGSRERSKDLINAGIVATAVLIFFQYFTWSFELLDRSIAFIIGGVLLITLSIAIEKKRRHLISQIGNG